MDKIKFEEFETLTGFMENVSIKLNCLPDYTGDYTYIYKQIDKKDKEIKKLKLALHELITKCRSLISDEIDIFCIERAEEVLKESR